MKLGSIETRYPYQLKDLASTEEQIAAALPAMREAAEPSAEAEQVFETHLGETEAEAEKINELFKGVGKTARGRKCKGIAGILPEGE